MADDVTGIGVVDDPLIPVALGIAAIAGVAALDGKYRVYVTYTLVNDEGQRYIGRTSGYGDPATLVAIRFAGHFRRLESWGKFHSPVVDRAVTGLRAYAAIRGREHLLINAYGGVRSPDVGNILNGIGPLNPRGQSYISASNMAFGPTHTER